MAERGTNQDRRMTEPITPIPTPNPVVQPTRPTSQPEPVEPSPVIRTEVVVEAEKRTLKPPMTYQKIENLVAGNKIEERGGVLASGAVLPTSRHEDRRDEEDRDKTVLKQKVTEDTYVALKNYLALKSRLKGWSEDYKKAFEYIFEHPNSTSYEVSQATGIEENLASFIMQYLEINQLIGKSGTKDRETETKVKVYTIDINTPESFENRSDYEKMQDMIKELKEKFSLYKDDYKTGGKGGYGESYNQLLKEWLEKYKIGQVQWQTVKVKTPVPTYNALKNYLAMKPQLEKLPDSYKRVFQYIFENPNFTSAEIAKILNIEESEVSKATLYLEANQLIGRSGSKEQEVEVQVPIMYQYKGGDLELPIRDYIPSVPNKVGGILGGQNKSYEEMTKEWGKNKSGGNNQSISSIWDL